jgi:hypothetical protein
MNDGPTTHELPRGAPDDEESLEACLTETIAWCHPRASLGDPGGSLRSQQLRPMTLEIDRSTAVRRVASARKARLAIDDSRSIGAISVVDRGRLLVYQPDGNLADGAAEVESRGFFDVDNTPPWDTWVALAWNPLDDRSTAWNLVSWVPEILLDLADRGIWANPERCIRWLADSDLPIADRLLRIGQSVNPR